MQTQQTTNFPILVNDLIQENKKKISDLTSICHNMTNEILKKWNDNWVKNGGCARCDGRETIVVWDTSDCLDGSYAEFAACPNCTDTSKKLGINISVFTKYDKVRGLFDRRQEIYGPALNEIKAKISELLIRNSELENLSQIKKQKVVCVTKGRKVPIGFVGKVFYIKENFFGYNKYVVTLGIKDNNENVHWIDSRNVQVVLDQNFLNE